jgi:hypothetical protein
VVEELLQLEEEAVVEELPQLAEEAAGDFYEQYDAYDDEFNWCKYAWSNECYALCQRYDASVECHASMPQLNAMPRAPMDNAAFGHQDGGAPQAPMDGAINQQDVGDTGGDNDDQLEGLTHAEQRHVRNQMILEAEERSSQRSGELMEEAIRNGLSREEAEGIDPEFGI